MRDKMLYVLGVAVLAMIAFTKAGDVRQSPPEPNCTLDPELCTKAK